MPFYEGDFNLGNHRGKDGMFLKGVETPFKPTTELEYTNFFVVQFLNYGEGTNQFNTYGHHGYLSLTPPAPNRTSYPSIMQERGLLDNNTVAYKLLDGQPSIVMGTWNDTLKTVNLTRMGVQYDSVTFLNEPEVFFAWTVPLVNMSIGNSTMNFTPSDNVQLVFEPAQAVPMLLATTGKNVTAALDMLLDAFKDFDPKVVQVSNFNEDRDVKRVKLAGTSCKDPLLNETFITLNFGNITLKRPLGAFTKLEGGQGCIVNIIVWRNIQFFSNNVSAKFILVVNHHFLKDDELHFDYEKRLMAIGGPDIVKDPEPFVPPTDPGNWPLIKIILISIGGVGGLGLLVLIGVVVVKKYRKRQPEETPTGGQDP